jgi:hypothetical protein
MLYFKSSSLIALFRSVDYVAFLYYAFKICHCLAFLALVLIFSSSQAALHVWKTIVANTPRTLKEIMPVLMDTLISSLASFSSERRQVWSISHCLISVGIYTILILLCIAILQVAGRSLGELVRKLGERVLPSIIPILSQGLKDPSASRRQVSYLNKMCLEDNFFFVPRRDCPPFPLT